MNIINERRTELSGTPYLNNAIDGITARVNHVFRQEHTDEGAHTDITAESVTVEEDITVGGGITVDGAISFGESNDVERADVGPDTFNESDDYPSISSNADQSKVALSVQRDLIPDVDDENYLGWQGTGDFTRRWRSLYFSRVVYGPRVVATTGLWERGRTAGVGEWAAVTFAAGNFTGNVGTWTLIAANQVSFTVKRVGTSVTVNYSFQNTNVGAGSSQLRIQVPASIVTGGRFTNRCSRAVDAGVASDARCVADASVSINQLLLIKVDGTNWTATAGNDTLIEGQIDYEAA